MSNEEKGGLKEETNKKKAPEGVKTSPAQLSAEDAAKKKDDAAKSRLSELKLKIASTEALLAKYRKRYDFAVPGEEEEYNEQTALTKEALGKLQTEASVLEISLNFEPLRNKTIAAIEAIEKGAVKKLMHGKTYTVSLGGDTKADLLQKKVNAMVSETVLEHIGEALKVGSITVTVDAEGKIDLKHSGTGATKKKGASSGTPKEAGSAFAGRQVTVDGVEYPSGAQACATLGIDTNKGSAIAVLKRKYTEVSDGVFQSK